VRLPRDPAAMRSIGHPLGLLLDLALPPACAGCGVEGEALCRTCRPAVSVRAALPPGMPMGLPDGPPDPLVQLEWCAPFDGVVRHALHALKYAGERRLARPLGEAVAERWARAGDGGDLLVPVPVHASRRRERGYDQAELIAAVAAAALGVPMAPHVIRERATTPQYRLDRRHRAANVADAFRVRDGASSGIAGRRVVLVDDVVTTGATLAATAEALLAAGAVTVSAVTVARER
jgi:ComF family protein